MPFPTQINVGFNSLLLIYFFLLIYAVERSVFAFTIPFKTPSIKHAWLTQFPFFSYVFLFFLSVFEFSLKGLQNKWLVVIGLSLFCCGVFLRYRAVMAFKLSNEKWLSHIEPNFIIKIVRIGPYRYMRHPYYLSVVLELCGIAVSLNALVTCCVILIIQTPFLLKRIEIEEEELVKKFGKDYLEYKSHVPSLLPFVRAR